jgi:hypothetical protein
VAARKGPAGLHVDVDGLVETEKAIAALAEDLAKQSSSEIRSARARLASSLAGALRAAAVSSGVPLAPRVARSIRPGPSGVAIGGPMLVGTGKRGFAAVLVWGSEQGPKSDPNRFAVAPNSAGYWIAPTSARFRDNDAVDEYRHAVHATLRAHRLV